MGDHKVLHIITGLNDGGAESTLVKLCAGSMQFRHVVICLMDEGKYGAHLRRLGIDVYFLRMNPGKPSARKFIRLINIIRKERPEVVQTWMYHADLLGGVAAKIAGVKKIFWGVHHTTLDKGVAKRSTIMVARLCMLLSRLIPSRIIFCSASGLKVHANLGYYFPKLVSIPNGYDVEMFCQNSNSRASLRAALDIGDDTFLVGNVSRFHPFKDHETLIRSFALASSLRPNIKFVLVGTNITISNQALSSILEEYNFGHHAILLGQRSDVPSIMNALDLHVLSSCSEAFPNVIAEAMACGTVCVSTDVGDAETIIGDRSLICAVGDYKKLAEMIVQQYDCWKNNSEVWRDNKRQCASRINSNFTVDHMAHAYQEQWDIGMSGY